MTSYGFWFYGPGSYVWYQTLYRYFPQPTVTNLMTKVLPNQIILGPAVIAVVFAWNNLWQGKLSELPKKYQNGAVSTLFFGCSSSSASGLYVNWFHFLELYPLFNSVQVKLHFSLSQAWKQIY